MELLGVALYALIAYPDRAVLPLEAAIKYLVLSGAASATMLFGFALLYAATGALGFTDIGTALQTRSGAAALQMAGAAMITVGLAFKMSLAPFHMWTPDVYEGAPSPVAGYLASVSKAAIFAVLLRFFIDARLHEYQALVNCIGLMAVLSMLLGNLLALQQDNIKRMLAYSSIAHMGYLVVVLIAATQPENRALAIEGGVFYLVAYTATTLAAFALLSVISSQRTAQENARLASISGLFWHQPLLALLMTVALLSLAGIPLTAGFIAKFYIFSAAVSGLHWILLGTLVVGSALGIFYYLRAIFYMTRRVEEHHNQFAIDHVMRVRTLSCVLILGILLLGVVPQPLMNYIQSILW
jgi:NADH-quinone oxidoreductase subunit N